MGSLSCRMICEGSDEKKEISFSEPSSHEKDPCIVVIDYGVKASILQAISSIGYNIALVSPSSLTVGYRSLIDGTIEGCISTQYPLITMQCHPEGAPGPSDMLHIFDLFHRMIQEK